MHKIKHLFAIFIIGIFFPAVAISQTIQWKSGNSTSGDEDSGTITWTMTAASYSGSCDPCNVQVSVKNSSTSTSSSDYSYFGTKTITITADGDYTVQFTLLDDNIDEDSETFILRMNPDGLSMASGESADLTYTIGDNDAQPTINVQDASKTVSEDAGSVRLYVTRDRPSQRSTQPSFDVSVGGTATGGGTDYNALSPTTYTFTASSSGLTDYFDITIQDDNIDEDSETIIFTIDGSNATNGSALVTTLTINDNDAAPAIDFSAATGSASEGNSGTSAKTAQVTLSAVSGKDVSANYTVGGTSTGGGTDHSAAAGTVNISAGQQTANISFNLVGETTYELDETIILLSLIHI